MKDNLVTTLSNGTDEFDYVMSDEDFKRIKESIEDMEAGNCIEVPPNLSREELRDFILNSKFD